MIERELPLDEDMGESFPAMKFDFPYIWFWGEVDHYIGGHVPWHWHDEPEFCHVIKGEIEYHFPEHVYILKEGDAMFVNSNVLHMICPHNGYMGAIMIPQVFNKLLFIGYHRSAIDNKYYRPIVNSQNIPCYFMHKENFSDAEIVQLLDDCYHCAEAEKFGYEVQVRSYISQIWLRLYQALEPQLRTQESAQEKHHERLKLMLNHIHTHYAEKITLNNIANAASISERECIRSFKKYMQLTPFQYIQNYRIDSAANMLMHSEYSITEIAWKCGFESSSYFSKLFKQTMHCTPKMYRDTSRQNLKLGFNIEKKTE